MLPALTRVLFFVGIITLLVLALCALLAILKFHTGNILAQQVAMLAELDGLRSDLDRSLAALNKSCAQLRLLLASLPALRLPDKEA